MHHCNRWAASIVRPPALRTPADSAQPPQRDHSLPVATASGERLLDRASGHQRICDSKLDARLVMDACCQGAAAGGAGAAPICPYTVNPWTDENTDRHWYRWRDPGGAIVPPPADWEAVAGLEVVPVPPAVLPLQSGTADLDAQGLRIGTISFPVRVRPHSHPWSRGLCSACSRLIRPLFTLPVAAVRPHRACYTCALGSASFGPRLAAHRCTALIRSQSAHACITQAYAALQLSGISAEYLQEELAKAPFGHDVPGAHELRDWRSWEAAFGEQYSLASIALQQRFPSTLCAPAQKRMRSVAVRLVRTSPLHTGSLP